MAHYIVRMSEPPDAQQAAILYLLAADTENDTVIVERADGFLQVRVDITEAQVERLESESWVAEVMRGSNLVEAKTIAEFQGRVDEILKNGLGHFERIPTVDVPEEVVVAAKNLLRLRYRVFYATKYKVLSVMPNRPAA